MVGDPDALEGLRGRLKKFRSRVKAGDSAVGDGLDALLEDIEDLGNRLTDDAEIAALGELLDEADKFKASLPQAATHGKQGTTSAARGATGASGPKSAAGGARLELPELDQWLEQRATTKPLVQRLRQLYDEHNSYPDRPEFDHTSTPPPEILEWRDNLDKLVVEICTTEVLLALEAGGGTKAVDSEKLLDVLTEQRIQVLKPVFEELARSDARLGELWKKREEAARQMRGQSERADGVAPEAGGAQNAANLAWQKATAAMAGAFIEHERFEEIARSHSLQKEMLELRDALRTSVAGLAQPVIQEGINRIRGMSSRPGSASLENWTPHRPRLQTPLKSEVEGSIGTLIFDKLMGTDKSDTLRGRYPIDELPLLRDLNPTIPPEQRDGHSSIRTPQEHGALAAQSASPNTTRVLLLIGLVALFGAAAIGFLVLRGDSGSGSTGADNNRLSAGGQPQTTDGQDPPIDGPPSDVSTAEDFIASNTGNAAAAGLTAFSNQPDEALDCVAHQMVSAAAPEQLDVALTTADYRAWPPALVELYAAALGECAPLRPFYQARFGAFEFRRDSCVTDMTDYVLNTYSWSVFIAEGILDSDPVLRQQRQAIFDQFVNQGYAATECFAAG